MSRRVSSWHDLCQRGIEACIEWLAASPLAADMAACRQDAAWHAEGDVWTHTQLVCRALPEVAGWRELSPETQAECTMAALLHDCGKPLTTAVDPATGRVHAPKHALVGSQIARHELAAIGCPVATRERIVAMVRHHAAPLHPLGRSDPAREAIRLSWFLENRSLEIVARADLRGRLCVGDARRSEDALDVWRLVCEENQAYDRPHPFANETARFRFFREGRFDPAYVPHERWQCRVTMMSGLPAAGKDAWLSRHRVGMPVVSLDSLREEMGIDPVDDQGTVAQAAKELCREHLRSRRDFAFNATNLRQQTRSRWVSLFHDYGARVEIVYVEPPLETIFRRNRGRERRVPTDVIERLWERIEPPTWAECHALVLDGHG